MRYGTETESQSLSASSSPITPITWYYPRVSYECCTCVTFTLKLAPVLIRQMKKAGMHVFPGSVPKQITQVCMTPFLLLRAISSFTLVDSNGKGGLLCNKHAARTDLRSSISYLCIVLCNARYHTAINANRMKIVVF